MALAIVILSEQTLTENQGPKVGSGEELPLYG
jgi:hypothetical protein